MCSKLPHGSDPLSLDVQAVGDELDGECLFLIFVNPVKLTTRPAAFSMEA